MASSQIARLTTAQAVLLNAKLREDPVVFEILRGDPVAIVDHQPFQDSDESLFAQSTQIVKSLGIQSNQIGWVVSSDNSKLKERLSSVLSKGPVLITPNLKNATLPTALHLGANLLKNDECRAVVVLTEEHSNSLELSVLVRVYDAIRDNVEYLCSIRSNSMRYDSKSMDSYSGSTFREELERISTSRHSNTNGHVFVDESSGAKVSVALDGSLKPRQFKKVLERAAINPSSLPSELDVSTRASEMLCDILAKFLFLAPSMIPRDQDFIDMGIDSVLAVELVKSINEGFNLNLKASELYAHRNVAQLADFLKAQSNRTASIDSNSLKVVTLTPESSIATQFDPKTAICEILSEFLLVPPASISRSHDFIDMGIDSVLAVEIVKRVNDKLGIRLKSSELYDCPTVEKLAAYIQKNKSSIESTAKVS